MEQYKDTGTVDIVKPTTKTQEQKTIETHEVTIKELTARVDSQYKVIDKLVRDVRKMKDQISELAGKIPRG